MTGVFDFATFARRRIVQWSLAYLAAAWGVVEAVTTLGGTYGWSPGLIRTVPFIAAVGLLVTLVVTWYHGERGAQRIEAAEALLLGLLLVIAGVGGAVLWRQESPVVVEGSAVPPAPSPAVGRASVAILPLATVGAEAGQEYFAEGLTDELINALAKVPGLHVTARTSSFAYRGSDEPIASIAAALRVAYVLDGSVRRDGTRVRVSVQLVEAASGVNVWSEAYDRTLADVFEIQAEIGAAVARQLRLRISADRPLAPRATADPEAHLLLLRARSLVASRTRELRDVLALLDAAVARDPDYADAHAARADVLLWMAAWRDLPPEAYEQARTAAERALQLDPDSASAHLALARIADMRDWDFARARALIARARELSPGSAGPYFAAANLELRLARLEEAMWQAQRAAALDPLTNTGLYTAGMVHWFAGRREEALSHFVAAIAIDPADRPLRGNLAATYASLGRDDEALAQLRELAAMAPSSQSLLLNGARVHWYAGRHEEAEALLARLAAGPHASPYRMASLHALFGRHEQAFELLERAIAEKDDNAAWLAVAPEFAAMREDARFQELLRRAGLLESS